MLGSPQAENTTTKSVETCIKTPLSPTILTANVATQYQTTRWLHFMFCVHLMTLLQIMKHPCQNPVSVVQHHLRFECCD